MGMEGQRRTKFQGWLYVGYLGVLIAATCVAIGLLAFGRSSSSTLAAQVMPTSTVAESAGGPPIPSTAPAAPSTTTTPVTSPPTSAPAPAATPSPAVPTTPTTPPPGTTYLPVAPGSGAGCTAGITEGNQWVKYTVQPGDNLSQIARCFDLNGYQKLYQDNEQVIGANPNLIFPGQVITIVNGVMTVTAGSSPRA